MAAFFRARTRRPAARRRGRAPFALSLGALAALVGACSLGFDDDGLNQPPAGGAGASSGGAGASVGGQSGAGPGGGGQGNAGAGAGGGGQGNAGAGASGANGAGGGGQGGAAGEGGGGGGAAGQADGYPVSLEGCVLLLHLDEALWVGDGDVTDSSGRDNDGNPINGAAPTTEGKFGRAVRLDGSNWIEVPDSASLRNETSALTYAAWVNAVEVPPDGAGIIAKREGFQVKSAFAVFLFGSTNQVYADVENVRLNSLTSVPLNDWHHVAVVYDGGHADPARRLSIYVDGAFDVAGAAPPVIAANTTDILIGNLINGGGTFRGLIDEVAIWTRPLREDEVKALATKAPPPP